MPQSCNLLFLEKMAVLSFHHHFSFPYGSHVEYIMHNQANGAAESVRTLIPTSHLSASSINPISVSSGKLNWGGSSSCQKNYPFFPRWVLNMSYLHSLVFSPSFRDTVNFIGQTLRPFKFTFLWKTLLASLYLPTFSPPPQPFEPVGTFQASY